MFFIFREGVNNTQRGGASLKLAAEGCKTLTPPKIWSPSSTYQQLLTHWWITDEEGHSHRLI